ncbi:GTP 3',8-cyclase MoaA [Celerinatantimonas sp. YJH-8]|uniref:GTP 3',8-cyclase MoaA n=1 Tax=Celerinatantimonas sp. YJH-8 TaxID=3228714 RepID=UPI0038C6C6D7
MLTDDFNRRFSYLRLSVTDVCNFKCQYCLPNGYQRPEQQPQFLTLPEIQQITQVFAQAGTTKIRLTGGEPTLRRDIGEIIEICAKTPGIETVAMTTNGFRLAQNAQLWKNAGLDRVNISVDSFDERLFNQITGTKSFSKVMSGIDAALAAGYRSVKINTVLMQHYNFAQFEKTLERLRNWPVELRYIELMETLEQRSLFSQEHVSGQQLKLLLLRHGWSTTTVQENAGPAQVFSHPDYCGKIGLILPYETNFCDSCNRLRVSARGKLHLCLFGEEGYDLRPSLQTQDPELLIETISQALAHKRATHYLHDHDPGQTIHLASVGG